MNKADSSPQLALVASELANGQEFLLTCHANPDGDALGSLLAMAHLLTEMGKTVHVYSADPVPKRLAFLPGCEMVRPDLPQEPCEWLIIMDCSEAERVSPELVEHHPWKRSMVIDHHLTERLTGDVNYVDPSAAATGEMIFRVAQFLGHNISPEFATCAFTAICTDTGSFRFSNTTPQAMAVASRLVEAGAVPSDIAQHVFESQSIGRLRLLGELLGDLELHFDNRVALIEVTSEKMQRWGVTKPELDGIVDFGRSIDGVYVSIQVREVEADVRYKASLRSRFGVSVESVASSFGGGGHKYAAGCELAGTRDDVIGRLLVAVESALDDAGQT